MIIPEGEVNDGKYSNNYFIIFIYYDKRIKNFVIEQSNVEGISTCRQGNPQR